MLNCRLESTESSRYVVLVEMFQDFGNVGFHVCYIGRPEDPVLVREYQLEFGVEDVLVQVNYKGKVIGGREAHRFIKDTYAVDIIEEVGMNKDVEESPMILSGGWHLTCQGLKGIDQVTG